MSEEILDLQEFIENASPEQRLALAKAGITLAILQEQVRMGFTNEEVATVLSMKDDGDEIEDAKIMWQERLEQYQDAVDEAV